MSGAGLSGRFVRLLTHLLPMKFRDEFGDEMLTAFLDVRDTITGAPSSTPARRTIGVTRLMGTTTLGLIRAAFAEHVRARRRTPHNARTPTTREHANLHVGCLRTLSCPRMAEVVAYRLVFQTKTP